MNYKWHSQGQDTSCFVVAAANAAVYAGIGKKFSMEEAKDIALCRHGGTINCRGVVDYIGTPLRPVKTPRMVLARGGIINIMHPIFNGHSIFIFKDGRGYTMINSWLGPNVLRGICKETILKFTCDRLGHHWYLAT